MWKMERNPITRRPPLADVCLGEVPKGTLRYDRREVETY